MDGITKLKKLSIVSVTDLTTTRSVNARVYVNFWFIVEDNCILVTYTHSPIANPDKILVERFQKNFPGTDIVQIPVAIIPEFVGSVVHGG